tara:strand:- start:81 stop:1661 length:1581 start_codon:yes stop_codon:yes gene_type:complete
MPDNQLPPETPILTGRKLSGRYVLKTPLFLGSHSQVWEADDLVLTRKVAIKLTNPELIYESAFIREFRSRARKSAQLNHPSIVPIYDTTGDEEIEAIVMELIEGMPLRAYIDEIGTMSAGKALNVLTQVVDALQHAHQQGIIHGDLNPENIFLCSDQQVKVSGFGLATAGKILQQTSKKYQDQIHLYLSPEQQNGEDPSEKSDIYALGAVILELLTGFSPDKKNQGTLNEVAQAFKESGRDIPENFQEPIVKAIDKEPKGRFTSPVAFRSAMNPESPPENARNNNMDFTPKTKQRDFNQIVTAGLTIGMVFAFILGIIFAAGLDDDLFGNGSSDTSVSNSENEEPPPPVEEEATEENENNQEEAEEEVPVPTTREATVSPIFEETPIVAAEDFDPLGDGVEHPELLSNLFDNDSSTSWKTETYGHRSLGFLKPGVGVVVQLEKSIDLHTLEIETESIGWSGQIFVSNTIGASLEAWGEPVALIEASSGTANVDLTGNNGLVVLVWITDLGDAPPSLKIEISEIRIT